MMGNFPLRAVLCQVAVVWLFAIETVSQSYTRTYDEYVFTSPGLSDYRKRNEAQILCTQHGSTLLEIKSSNVQDLTVRFLSDTGIQFADGTLLSTNGIRNDSNSWNWVNDQDINSITVYGQSQSQGLANSFGYISFNTNPASLHITAGAPTDMRGYICQAAGKVDCTNGFSKNGSCYKSYSSPTMSWFDARNRCLNGGGDLASFDFINNDQKLNSTLYGSWLSLSTSYWIGLRRQKWTWQTSNLEARYTNWMNGRPVYVQQNQCICLSKSGIDWKWIECDCGSAFPFVCLTEQSSIPSTSSYTTKVITSALPTRIVSILNNITATYSSTSTPPPLPEAMAIGSTDSRVLAVGLGIGIPSILIIVALIVLIVMMKKKLSYQTSHLANTIGDADTVTHAQSPVKRDLPIGVNGSVEMVSEQNTSPYESLKREETTINDGSYQELRIPGERR